MSKLILLSIQAEFSEWSRQAGRARYSGRKDISIAVIFFFVLALPNPYRGCWTPALYPSSYRKSQPAISAKQIPDRHAFLQSPRASSLGREQDAALLPCCPAAQYLYFFSFFFVRNSGQSQPSGFMHLAPRLHRCVSACRSLFL